MDLPRGEAIMRFSIFKNKSLMFCGVLFDTSAIATLGRLRRTWSWNWGLIARDSCCMSHLEATSMHGKPVLIIEAVDELLALEYFLSQHFIARSR